MMRDQVGLGMRCRVAMGHDVPVFSGGIWIVGWHGDALGEPAGSNEKSSRLTAVGS